MAETAAAAYSPLGRRHVLGALLAAPMVAAMPAAARSADHALIAAIDTAMGLSDEIRTRLEHAIDWRADERLCAVSGCRDALVARACATPATTPEGLAAKARMLLDRYRGDGAEWGEDGCILTSLCRDLIGDPNA